MKHPHPWYFNKPKDCFSSIASLCCSKEEKAISQNPSWLFCIQQTVWISSPNDQKGIKIHLMQNFLRFTELELQQTAVWNPWQLHAPFQLPSGHGLLPEATAWQGQSAQNPAWQPATDRAPCSEWPGAAVCTPATAHPTSPAQTSPRAEKERALIHRCYSVWLWATSAS